MSLLTSLWSPFHWLVLSGSSAALLDVQVVVLLRCWPLIITHVASEGPGAGGVHCLPRFPLSPVVPPYLLSLACIRSLLPVYLRQWWHPCCCPASLMSLLCGVPCSHLLSLRQSHHHSNPLSFSHFTDARVTSPSLLASPLTLTAPVTTLILHVCQRKVEGEGRYSNGKNQSTKMKINC